MSRRMLNVTFCTSFPIAIPRSLTPILTVLNVSYTSVSSVQLSRAITMLPLLSSIMLSNCPNLFINQEIEKDDKNILMLQLLLHKLLRSVNVSNNPQLNDSIVLHSLARLNKNSLDMQNRPVRNNQTSIKKTSCLWTSIDLSFNENLTNVSLVPLFKILHSIGTLKLLSVTSMKDDALTALCNIDEEKINSNSIKNHSTSTLTSLDISGCNELIGFGLEKVLFHHQNTIRSLYISGISTTSDDDAIKILQCIKMLPLLNVLDISGNKCKFSKVQKYFQFVSITNTEGI
jgi:hypothetical protein